MYTTQFFPLFKRHLFLCRYMKTFPYDFNANTGRLFKVTDPKLGKRHKRLCIIIFLYMTTILLSLTLGNTSVPMKMIGFVFILTYCVPAPSQWNYKLEITSIQVLNSFMDFETKVLKGIICFASIIISCNVRRCAKLALDFC